MRLYLLISFCIAIVHANDNEVSANECVEKCEMSFPNHTSTKNDENLACQRGCRFHVLGQFLQKQGLVMSFPLVGRCHLDCDDSYKPKGENNFACKAGCDAAEFVEQSAELQEEHKKLHSMVPVWQIREIASKAYGVLHMIQTSVTTFFKTDDDTILAVKGPTHVGFKIVPEDKNSDNHVEPLALPSNDDTVKIEKLSANSTSGLAMPYVIWMLVLLGFSLSSLYLIFMNVPASLKKSKAVKSIPPTPSVVPVKLIRPEDLTKLSIIDDEDMASPLPPKIKMPDSKI